MTASEFSTELKLLWRSRFFMECFRALQLALEELGSGLVLSQEPPAAAARRIADAIASTSQRFTLYYHMDYGCRAEEEAQAVERAISESAKKAGEKEVADFWISSTFNKSLADF